MSDAPYPDMATGSADGLRLAIVVGRCNGKYSEALLRGALDKLFALTSFQAAGTMQCAPGFIPLPSASAGYSARACRYHVLHVPGALELPLAARWFAEAHYPDAVVALGVVLRGDTPHFDYVSTVSMQGLVEVSLRTGVPVTCGVLTVNSEEQAAARSGDNADNRGAQAMVAAVAMARLRRQVG